jgi:hypothetical protein
VVDLATRDRTSFTSSEVHGVERKDDVVREVLGFGLIPKIGTLAALRALPGVRAEIAWTSLGRAYFANCMRRDNKWTSGLHLAWWALERLTDDPDIDLQDLRGEVEQPLKEWTDLAKWFVVASRLLLLLDVSDAARNQPKANGIPRMSPLIVESFVKIPAGSGARLLRHLNARRRAFAATFPEKHYRSLAMELHAAREEAELQ